MRRREDLTNFARLIFSWFIFSVSRCLCGSSLDSDGPPRIPTGRVMARCGKETWSMRHLLVLLGIALAVTEAPTVKPETPSLQLTQEQASSFARLALKCLDREYPNKPEHVLNGSGDVQS